MGEFEGFGEAEPQKKPRAKREAKGSVLNLPDDLNAVWGGSARDVAIAAALIDAWGVDVFRGSAVHALALQEARRDEVMEEPRKLHEDLGRVTSLKPVPSTPGLPRFTPAAPKGKERKGLCSHRLPPGTWCRWCDG